MEVPLKKQEIKARSRDSLETFFWFCHLHQLSAQASLLRGRSSSFPAVCNNKSDTAIYLSIYLTVLFGKGPPKDFRGQFPQQIEPKYRAAAAAPFFELYQCMGGSLGGTTRGQGSRGCR